MSFEDLLISRSAAVYADFLEPYLTAGDVMLDVGCGSGSITVGLAPKVDRVIGDDLDDAEFVGARTHARRSWSRRGSHGPSRPMRTRRSRGRAIGFKPAR